MRLIEAANGEEGLEVFKKRLPDIVLLDFMMPVMNGIEFCRHLRKIHSHSLPLANIEAEEANLEDRLEDSKISMDFLASQKSENLLLSINQTPVLIVTALEDSDSVTQAFEVGATDFITKPIHWDILKHRVKHLLNQAKLYQSLEAVNEKLQRLAAIDPLTQLSNRRVFDLVLERQWRLMFRNQTPFSLIFADIDYFKNYNDFYGHQAGDHCLFEVAQAIAKQAKRPTDLVARYGGEEITIVLPDTSFKGAELIANNILSAVRDCNIPHEKSGTAPFITVSLGVAVIENLDPNKSSDQLLMAADNALYHAKDKGRNCMVSHLIT